MDRIIHYPLGQTSNEFVQQTISDFGLYLSRTASEFVDLSAGSAFGLVTEKTNYNEIREYRDGRIWFEDPISPEVVVTIETLHGFKKHTNLSVTVLALINIIRSYLKTNENNICIFENYNANPVTPYIKYSLGEKRFYEDQVYEIVFSDESSVQEVWNPIRDTESGHCHIGIMTSFPESISGLRERQTFTRDELDILAKRTQKVFVGAYDMESYVIWEK